LATTLHNPRAEGSLERLAAELDAGAVGVKILPAYLRLASDAPGIRAALDLAADRGRVAVFGFEDTEPPLTPTVVEHLEGIGRLASDYPRPDPAQPRRECRSIRRIRPRAGRNRRGASDDPHLDLGLGGPLMEWSDAWRYPFPNYLRNLGADAELIPERQIAWGTDWPWFEGVAKYPQLLQAIVDHATFFSEDDRRRYLGGNAVRHWRLSI
jgi:predicted TIM-barrel fold metal-dependent hydrolase